MDAEGQPMLNTIVTAAKQRLRKHSHLAVQKIWCEMHGDALFLRGHVPNFYYKQLAQVAVAGLEGINQVVNEIEVTW
jgi:hypothetical protein